MHTTLSTSLAILLPLAAWTAPTPLEHGGKHAEPGFVLEAGTHEFEELVNRAAEFLGENHLMSETDFAGGKNTFALQTQMTLDKDGLRDVLGQFGYRLGFTKVPLDPDRGTWEWINQSGPRRNEIAARPVLVPVEQLETFPESYAYVRTIISVEHLEANRLTNSLRPFVAGNGASNCIVGTTGDGGSFLLQGYCTQVRDLARLVNSAEEHAGRTRTEALIDRLEQLEHTMREK